MSIDCCIKVISEADADALARDSVSVETILSGQQPRQLLPLGCAVLSFLPCAFIAVGLVHSFPSVKWFSVSGVAILWILMAQLPQRLWSWALGRLSDTSVEPRTDGHSLHLEKSWAGLHYLFTGTTSEGEEPLCYLMHGGQEVGMTPSGPVRLLSAEQVQEFRQRLSTFTPAQLRDRYDPIAMKRLQVYPNGWDEPNELDWLLEEFGRLRTFLDSNRGNAILISLG